MDSFTSVTNSFNDVEGNNENELNPKIVSKLKKQQIPTKNFMSSTICTANKAAVTKKKVLAERNETLDVAEQTSLQRSSSFDSKSVKSPVVNGDNDVQKPYDPVNNYLSPRPKFLRYNPDRRRKIFVEDSVRKSNSFDAELEFGEDSSGFVDSCSQKESEKGEDMMNVEGEIGEDEESGSEDEEEEMVEVEKGWKLTGFLEFLFVVIAVVWTTKAICSMNSPTHLQSLENWSDVYGVAGLNVSGVGRCSMTESDLVARRLMEVLTVETFDAVYADEVVNKDEASDSLQELESTLDLDEEIDEADVVHGEMWGKEEASDSLQELETRDLDEENDEADVIHGEIMSKQEDTVEITASKVMEIGEVDGERELDDQTLTENANDIEEIVEETEKIDDVETTDLLIRSESSDLKFAIVTGVFMLTLTFFGVMYRSKRMRNSSPVTSTVAGANHQAEKEEIKVSELSANQSSLIQQTKEEERLVNSTSSLKYDDSEESSHIHAPSVQLLGEFVFGEEGDASNSLIQATTVSSGETKPSGMENSTGDSGSYTGKTVRKQRRKIAEATAVVTPSPAPSPVRRSSRLQSRSIKSP